MAKKKPKRKRQALPPAREILTLLVGVLASGYPYSRGRCITCNSKKAEKHHPDCIYEDATRMVLRYY